MEETFGFPPGSRLLLARGGCRCNLGRPLARRVDLRHELRGRLDIPHIAGRRVACMTVPLYPFLLFLLFVQTRFSSHHHSGFSLCFFCHLEVSTGRDTDLWLIAL